MFLRSGDRSPLVILLKHCLEACVEPAPDLDDSPSYDADTERAVSRLQSVAGIIVDGIVGPFTWTVIGRRLREKKAEEPPMGAEVPDWVRRLLRNDPKVASIASLEVPRALEIYQFGSGVLSASQRDGLTFLAEVDAAATPT